LKHHRRGSVKTRFIISASHKILIQRRMKSAL